MCARRYRDKRVGAGMDETAGSAVLQFDRRLDRLVVHDRSVAAAAVADDVAVVGVVNDGVIARDQRVVDAQLAGAYLSLGLFDVLRSEDRM